MTRPWLVMLTGEPGSGKSTLAPLLASELRLPHISRDAVRGGQLASAGWWRGRLDTLPPRESAVDALVEIVEAGAAAGVSFIVEFVVAEGREEAWARLQRAADVIVVVVETSRARERAEERDRSDPLLTRPGVLAALGYESMDAFMASSPGLGIRSTMRTDLDRPTLRVRTDDGYDPPIPAIVDWIVDTTRSR